MPREQDVVVKSRSRDGSWLSARDAFQADVVDGARQVGRSQVTVAFPIEDKVVAAGSGDVGDRGIGCPRRLSDKGVGRGVEFDPP